MENGPARSKFWQKFILEKCNYPSISRLSEQFECARFTDFCDCGCNSFGVEISDRSKVPPLLPPISTLTPKGHWSVYEADFMLVDGKSLEIVIFADGNGNLVWVEVDCCANSYPVPAEIAVTGPPFHTSASDKLYR